MIAGDFSLFTAREVIVVVEVGFHVKSTVLLGWPHFTILGASLHAIAMFLSPLNDPRRWLLAIVKKKNGFGEEKGNTTWLSFRLFSLPLPEDFEECEMRKSTEQPILLFVNNFHHYLKQPCVVNLLPFNLTTY